MQGTGIALANGPRVVFDSFNDHGEDGKVDKALVEKTVRDFISRRKDHQLYSVERVVDVNGKKERDSLKVHSAFR